MHFDAIRSKVTLGFTYLTCEYKLQCKDSLATNLTTIELGQCRFTLSHEPAHL